ncbi:hypothetical protein AB0D74_41525 [Streptomyces sp. NPDC048278]|uniref:hypothetical protein n=1 Tax=Streptomyces sp. NPDC048278 TaxID=3155809 RepID=UPI003437F039
MDRAGRERVYASITGQRDTVEVSPRCLSEDERIVIADLLRARKSVRRARSEEGKIRRDPELKEFIQQHLDRRWSPEQISQVLRSACPDEPDRHLAHETVYQAIYLPHRGGLERKPGVLRSDR